MPEPADHPAGTEVTIRLAESFTPLEARVLHDLAERVPPGTVLDLDFRRVRLWHDTALLSLARDIGAGRARYALHGLPHHQARLLDWLGGAA